MHTSDYNADVAVGLHRLLWFQEGGLFYVTWGSFTPLESSGRQAHRVSENALKQKGANGHPRCRGWTVKNA